MQSLTAITLVLASISTGISGLLLYKQQQRPAESSPDIPGEGLGSYDFSSPQAALVSRTRMHLNGDLRAMLEYERTLNQRRWDEEIKSFEVHETIEHRGRVVVLYAQTVNGIKTYEHHWMEKDAMTGYWHTSSQWDPATRSTGDKAWEEPVYRKIREWKQRNEKKP